MSHVTPYDAPPKMCQNCEILPHAIEFYVLLIVTMISIYFYVFFMPDDEATVISVLSPPKPSFCIHSRCLHPLVHVTCKTSKLLIFGLSLLKWTQLPRGATYSRMNELSAFFRVTVDDGGNRMDM
jgi:hypothetical protein